MEKKFYETKEGHKILNKSNWPENLKEFRALENQYLLENIKNKESLLDIGCGLGRHLILLKNKIKRLLGIDHSESILKQAKKVYEIPNIKVINVDIKDFETEEKFDYIICMFNTFGNIDQENQKILLEKAKSFLKENGKLILSIYSENAKDDQIQFYKNIGLTINGFDENFVYTVEGFASERFSKEKIKEVIEVIEGLKINKIFSLNKIYYIVEISKK